MVNTTQVQPKKESNAQNKTKKKVNKNARNKPAETKPNVSQSCLAVSPAAPMCESVDSHFPLLPTMWVIIYKQIRYIAHARVMYDSGSQINLIRSNTIKFNKNLCEPTKMEIIGIMLKPCRITQQITLDLVPWFAHDTCTNGLTVPFLIMPKTATEPSYYPPTDVTCAGLTNKLEGPLADPYFWLAA